MRLLQEVRKGTEQGLERLARWIGSSGAPPMIARIAERSHARLRLMTNLAIWYHADYSAPGIAASARLPDLDLERGKRVVHALEELGYLRERDVRKGAPIALDVLVAAHSLSYLESVTEPAQLARIFGLDGESVDVDAILRAQRRAAGGTLEAAQWAISSRGRLAFNLGGGFHHAEPDSGSGFCVYNDVAASVFRLRRQGFAGSIAIVDLDFHPGNGNSVTFAADRSVFTYSIHCTPWSHSETVEDMAVLLPGGTTDNAYRDALRSSLEPALWQRRPELIFYLAGTDILEGDALGEFRITDDGAFERDRYVLDLASKLDASVVVTLAGGYSTRAWKSSARMLRWALTGKVGPMPTVMQGIRRRYARIANSLDPFELQFGDDDITLSEADLLAALEGPPRSNRLLGYYSVHGAELVLERYGFLEALRGRGFRDLRLDVDPRDPERQRIAIYGRKKQGPYHLLVELLLSRRSLTSPIEPSETFEMLSIEWLLLQDPSRTFLPRQAPLPGQSHPGLGLLRELVEILYQACLRLKLDGIVMHPSRFHISAVAAGQCLFLDPEVQGRFDALQSQLATQDVSRASRLVEEGRVLRGDGSVFHWLPEDFVAPVSEDLQQYFGSETYSQQRKRAKQQALEAGIRLVSSPDD